MGRLKNVDLFTDLVWVTGLACWIAIFLLGTWFAAVGLLVSLAQRRDEELATDARFYDQDGAT